MTTKLGQRRIFSLESRNAELCRITNRMRNEKDDIHTLIIARRSRDPTIAIHRGRRFTQIMRNQTTAQVHDLNAQRLAAIEAASQHVTEVGARLIARLMQIRVLASAVARSDQPPPVRDAVIAALGTVAKHAEVEIEYDIMQLEKRCTRARAACNKSA